MNADNEHKVERLQHFVGEALKGYIKDDILRFLLKYWVGWGISRPDYSKPDETLTIFVRESFPNEIWDKIQPILDQALMREMNEKETKSWSVVFDRACIVKVTPFQLLAGIGPCGQIESSGAFGSGTLGAIVLDEEKIPYLLSCKHVLGDEGCEISWVQSGLEVAVTRQTVQFSTEPIPADAGIAEILPDQVDGIVPGDFYTQKTMSLEPCHEVTKCGAATGSTVGRIKYARCWLRIEVDGVSRWFRDIALVARCGPLPFASAGDSGAIVLDISGCAPAPVGMVFATTEVSPFNATGPSEEFVAVCSLSRALEAFLPRKLELFNGPQLPKANGAPSANCTDPKVATTDGV